MANAAGVANPMGNAVKNSFALAVAAGPADGLRADAGHAIAGVNGVELKPAKKG